MAMVALSGEQIKSLKSYRPVAVINEGNLFQLRRTSVPSASISYFSQLLKNCFQFKNLPSRICFTFRNVSCGFSKGFGTKNRLAMASPIGLEEDSDLMVVAVVVMPPAARVLVAAEISLSLLKVKTSTSI